MTENSYKCGKCGYFDGMCCKKDNADRDADEIVSDCKYFEKSIYW